MIKASRRETGMKNHIQEPFFFFFKKKISISSNEKSLMLPRANVESKITVTHIYPIIC